MITRGGYSNDYKGKGTLLITRGGYFNDYEGGYSNVTREVYYND